MHRLGLRFGLVVGLVAAVVVTATGSASTVAAKQRIAIEERSVIGVGAGTFKLLPLTPGAIKADAGKFTFSVKARPTVVVAGRRVTTYVGMDVLEGRRGTLQIRTVTTSAAAGGGYLIGSGPWSVLGGTKAYVGVRGGGTGSGVVTPQKVIFTRYEGYVGGS